MRALWEICFLKFAKEDSKVGLYLSGITIKYVKNG
jgi:hypothetical protein